MGTDRPPPVNLQPSKTQSRLVDPTEGIRQLRNEIKFGNPGTTSAYGANLTPTADPFGRTVAFTTGLDNDIRICVGEIIDGTASANAYRVNVERLRTPLMATALTTTGQSVLGAAEINTYAPGTSVLLATNKELTYGIILGALPPVATRGKESVHDFLHQASRSRVDEGHAQYLKFGASSNLANWSSWRPFDNTHGGEWGAITTTGLKVTLDDFMVQMAVNEFTGVFGFYHDQLLRIGGYNLQTWTAGHERDAYMDQAEYNDTQGYTPYPWEAVGLLTPGGNTIQEYTSATFMMAQGRPYYGHWENVYENQQPFHRTQKFYGYYGQGGRSLVVAPPQGQQWWTYRFSGGTDPAPPFESTVDSALSGTRKAVKGDAKQSQHDERPAVGLAEDNTALDGRRFIASAKGITLVKRLLLPVPSRVRRPEDGNGDTEQTYKFAGAFGGGQEHAITGGPEASGDKPHLQRAAGVLDLHAYLFNYVGLHPFHWHLGDYRTWEQSQLEHAQYNHAVPSYSALKGSMYLPEPTSTNIYIDHRYGSQKYYVAESFITQLEDGGIVIGDGYGAEIRMTAGSVTISAPGDVWFKSGKNTQIWAGRDCIVRADKTVDVSATEDNVRIKAEQNVMVLAGNDSSPKMGGVLIESRANAAVYNFDTPGDSVVFGGIVMRAKKAEVVTHAKDIYIRTVGGFEGTDDPPGNITIDASRGTGTIVTKSHTLINYLDANGGLFHAFRAEPDAAAHVASAFGPSSTYLNAPLYLDGPIVADGKVNGYSFMARNNIFINNGHIFTRPGGPAKVCAGKCISDIDAFVLEIKKQINFELPQKLETFDDEKLDPLWYVEKRAGHADSIRKIEFSFRKDEEYRVDDFELFEDRWQQMARLSGQSLDTWEEKPVKTAAGDETWPFPGKAKLIDEDVFVMQDFSLLDIAGNNIRDKDRESGTGGLAAAYKTPKLSDAQRATIAAKYLIIK